MTGSRRENRRALARNGRVPSRSTRDAGVSRAAANRRARVADAASCRGLQRVRAIRAGWRLVPYDLLRVGLAPDRVWSLRRERIRGSVLWGGWAALQVPTLAATTRVRSL